jgi:DNA primase
LKIPQHKIEEIASSIDIVDVISAFTPLRKAGRSFMGRCPFHEEKTPSFSVSQEKGVYHCFGCGKSGNVFTFVMDTENLTFFEAAKQLAEKAGVKLEFEDEPFDADKNLVETLVEINRKAARYFHDNLMGRDGEYAREYLRERGIKEEMITKFGLGYSLREKDALHKELSKEYSREELIASGLFLNLPQNEMRDRFRGRLMFPIISESSRVAGFGGRKLYEETGFDEAKYVNSSETKIYNKSRILYGLNLSKNKIKEEGYVILVEGYMDLISLFQNGFENVVASSGTSLTALQVKILSRYTHEVVVVYDSDIAGQNASMRAIELIIENNLNVNIVVLPQGEDPDTYIRKNGKEAFQNLLTKRQSVINYIGDQFKKEGKLESPEGKTEFVRRIITLIAKMRDEIKRDFYIKDISERFSIYESIIRKELDNQLKLSRKGLTREIKAEPTIQINSTIEKYESEATQHEINLVRLLVDSDQETKDFLAENLEIGYITNPNVLTIVNYVIMNIDKPNKIAPVNLYNQFSEPSLKEVINKALFPEYVVLDENKKKLTEAKNYLINLKLSQIESELHEIDNKIKLDNRDTPDNRRLMKKKHELREEKRKLTAERISHKG